MTEISNADQVTYWNEIAGGKWVANQERLDRVFTPLTAALIEAAAIAAGEHVLDVGCGCGETSFIAARAAGPGGHVLAIDISAPMLAHAKVRAAATPGQSRAPIDFLLADAMTHAFAPEADILMSRFGVMFFIDPLAAFVNLKTALKPGARFAFMSWRPRAEVEWMQWPLDQVAPLLPTPPVILDAPGPFRFSNATETRAMLSAAGFKDVSATPVDAPLVLGAGADPVVDAMILLRDTGPFATLFRDADPAVRPEAEALIRTALAARVADGQVTLGGACWIYRGRA